MSDRKPITIEVQNLREIKRPSRPVISRSCSWRSSGALQKYRTFPLVRDSHGNITPAKQSVFLASQNSIAELSNRRTLTTQIYRKIDFIRAKEKIEQDFPEILRSIVEKRRRTRAVEKLRTTIRKASQEAIENGLTPEILESILNDAE